MAEPQDWRSLLTASERYDNIQKIQNVINSSGQSPFGKTAFAIENDAYTSSSLRHEYDAACNLAPPSPKAHTYGHELLKQPDSSPPYFKGQGEDDGEPGIRIGLYQSCHYIASGVTAEVYRCKDRALKVITETRNIEPHNPFREAKILSQIKKSCIPLLETFRDQEQRFTLVFPYMPLTLSELLERGPVTDTQLHIIFTDLFSALDHVHSQGIIHRDIKPSALLLASPTGPAYLSDFGTAWHPEMSIHTEPAENKILDIGTGPYRAPEVLFGNKAYGTAVDMWGAGAMLAECVRNPPKPLFESRAAHEDGNQLGLILSIFKTIGTPTRETWPEAAAFKTPPFEIYQSFDGRSWEDILPGVGESWRDLIVSMVKYDSRRLSAAQALKHLCLKET